MQDNSIIKNFLYNVILSVSTVLFPLLVFPYISRTLGPSGIGKVDFANSVLTYFILFANLGIPTYGIKECARLRDDKHEFSKTVHEIFIISMVLTTIVYIVFIVMLNTVPKFREEKTLFILMGIIMILNTIGFDWLFRALELYKLITVRSILCKTISVLLMFLLVKSSEDYIIYGLLHVTANYGYNLINFFDVKKRIDKVELKELDFSRHFKMILTFFAMSASTTIYNNSASVFLGFLRNSYEVGLYDVAVKVKNVLMGIVTSLGTVLLPRMSYYYQKGENDRFKELIRLSFSFIYLISIPLCIFFILFAKEAILILSDDRYLEAINTMRIVMPLLLIIGLTNIIGVQIMIPSGHEKEVLKSQIIAGIINIILNALLVKKYGYNGAAVTILCTELIVLLLEIMYLKKINKSLLSLGISYKMIIANIISIITCLSIRRLITGNFITILISSIVYFIVYFVSLLVMKEESLLEILRLVKS